MNMKLRKITKEILAFAVSSAYAAAVFIATGIPQTAMATSCEDVVPGTNIKYSSALVHFIYDGTKTYAIAKSAQTGSQNIPDAFFAFSSWIDRDYEYTGNDTSSLKLQINNKLFGDARPVLIDSQTKRDFIIQHYKQFLDASSSNKSTYVEAWKEYGVGQAFTDFSGAALPYTSWALGVPPNTSKIASPQGVVMGLDGIWANGENGQRISQIVEFNGKLDCATDLTANVTTPTTTSTLLQGRVCGQDLNSDGDIGEDEIKACVTTTQGTEYCPVGSADCTPTYQTATCTAGAVLNTSLDVCQIDPAPSTLPPVCISGTTYNSATSKCESSPVCSSGAYDPTVDSCNIGNNTCPLGSAYACADIEGKMQCNSNTCFDSTSPTGGEDETEMDESMYQDDARNADGSCSGQLMIFAGKGSRCRPPGMKVGYINNCCQSDEVMTEDTGNTISSAISAIQTMYELGQVAYYTYMLSTGSAAVTGVTTGSITVSVAGTATTLTGATATGVATGAAASATGASLAGSMLASVQAYATALLNPATIIVAVVIMVVMKVLMGSGCDAKDIQTAGQVKADQCHYIDSYCQKKWFIGCVQKAKGYCCFNSMMARIIHEQGRPQLTTFGLDGSWGTPKKPNCRGFTPEEFESLDFSKIDFSEYYAVLQKDMATNITNAQTKIQTTIQNRKDQIQ
ncbi:conjugal transfer protein TraN [Pelobacter propionicus]|uniref:Mating pair stabilization protein TraN n=1 Tax=Pelobacter propionicus (strain DSM 2379 / NBRC 103807 / OttBd1) TaxID=338966 RepID=A0R7Q6_PELPD|nr:conjugal transfer protein TraN [Pelobacter propionicus]ABL01364.1 hypothetical protein Ppro_3775 [Pelobacter propionicus DSM 2379]